MFVPPKEVYETPPQSAKDRLAAKGYVLTGFQRVTRSSGGEMLAYFEGHPVPRKGMPTTESVMKTNEVKRALMMFLLPLPDLRKGLVKFIESFLYHFCRLADSIYDTCDRVPYYKKEYYVSTGKGIWDLLETFLLELGVKGEILLKIDGGLPTEHGETRTVANRIGQIGATVLENDDAYRMPIVDIMSEFTKEEIIADPRGFIDKAVRIFEERSDNSEFKGKVRQISRLVKWILVLPKFKRAFRKAFESIDLTLLQYDEYDEYWSLGRKGYDAKGVPFEKRFEKFKQLIEGFNI